MVTPEASGFVLPADDRGVIPKEDPGSFARPDRIA
jgi:hypothetical protein